jgi:hypothetical protein
VGNVLLVVEGVGSFLTDEFGSVVIDLPESLLGSVLIINPRKSGVQLDSLAFTVGETENIELEAQVEPVPAACRVTDISEKRLRLDANYVDLHEYASESLNELLLRKRNAPLEVTDRIRTALAELTANFEQLQALSANSLPTARWICPRSEATCSIKTHGRSKRQYRRLIIRSYEAYVAVLADLLSDEIITKSYNRGQVKEMRLLKRLALSRLKRLRLRTSECE